MKRGGRIIYFGPLGTNSQLVIDYFNVRLSVSLFAVSPSLHDALPWH